MPTKIIYCFFILTLFVGMSATAEIPQQDYDESEKGRLLSHTAPEMGRLAIIEILGDYLITVPEAPSSPPNSDFIVRAWNISDPTNPVEVGQFGETSHPFLAHGLIKSGNELLIGGWPNDTIRLEPDGSLTHTQWSGPEGHFGKGGLMRPWAAKSWWSYDEISDDAWLSLDGETTATWDHLAEVGVIGFPIFMGNLMIYASDQSNTGVATYDISDPANPVLLDHLNMPELHPTITDFAGNPVEWGIGGYWSEVSGHYVVFARRNENAGIQVVDFSDPSNLRLHCEMLTNDPARNIQSGETRSANPMYVNFQDQWAFAGEFKLNIETCELDLVLDERGDSNGQVGHFVDTSQYTRPIGNLIATGGQLSRWNWPASSNGAGLGLWVHQAESDTNPPYVSYHIPQPNQSNFPIMAPLSFSIPETLRSETIIMGETVTVTEVGGEPIALQYVLSHTGMLTVDPIEYLKEDTEYLVELVGIQDAVGNEMEPYSFRFSTGNLSTNTFPVINSIDRDVNQPVVGQNVQFTIEASDAEDEILDYRYRINGEEYSAWSSNNKFEFSSNIASNYSISVQVRDSQNATVTQVINLSFVDSLSQITQGLTSSQMAFTEDNKFVWVLNPDNSLITKINTESLAVEGEFYVGVNPKSVAIDTAGNLWITAHESDSVGIFNSDALLTKSIDLGYGSAPFGIVINPVKEEAYVSLYGAGELVKISTTTQEETGRITLGPTARAVAVSANGNDVLVTRFISAENWAEVWRVDANLWVLDETIKLYKHLVDDDLDDGRGVPNYVSAVIINEDSTKAYLVAKKDNTDRGLLNGSLDLDDDNTVRTMAMTIDLSTNSELRAERIDFDNADSPSAVAFSPLGNYLLVSIQGRNQLVSLPIDASGNLQNVSAQFTVGHAPQAILVDNEKSIIWVKNFTDRSVSIISAEGYFLSAIPNPEITELSTVTTEALGDSVLRGKRIFYDAANGIQASTNFKGKMSAEGYISCATCHIDGGHDGRTYDFTGRGEGIRNNISLKGRKGVRFGNVHWSANFDEIQDFENDIRNAFLGRGFMLDSDFETTSNPVGNSKAGLSDELDDLAEYVTSLGRFSLPKSPYRESNGNLTAEGENGKVLFEQLDCSSCHRSDAYTDGVTHNINTVHGYSGNRLAGEFTAIKTPSLLGLFDSAPYLHDGSASTLDAVFMSAGGEVYEAEDLTHNGTVITQSGFSYLRSGAAIKLNDGENLSFSISASNPGKAAISIRYGSSAVTSSLIISVNGDDFLLSLLDMPQVEEQDVNFIEGKVVINLVTGENDVAIKLEDSNGNTGAIIDSLVVASELDFAKAHAHTKVMNLQELERGDLNTFLLQIDRSSAPADTAEITLGDEFQINTAPSVENQSVQTEQDTELSGQMVGGDIENDVISYVLSQLNAQNGNVSITDLGVFTYTPSSGFIGTDSFGIKSFDGQYYSQEAIVTITVFQKEPTVITDQVETESSGGGSLNLYLLALLFLLAVCYNPSRKKGKFLAIKNIKRSAF